MARKKHSPKQIVAILRQIEIEVATTSPPIASNGQVNQLAEPSRREPLERPEDSRTLRMSRTVVECVT